MKKSVIQRALSVFLVVILLVGTAGCGGTGDANGGSGSDDSLQKVLDAKQFVLGLDPDYPPMGYTDESGEIVGFDLDAAKKVCDRLGVELVIKPVKWEEKEDKLNAGEIDCIWSGMSVTPERAEAMNLSEGYLKNSLIFVVREGSDIKGRHDMKGKTIGIKDGSSAVEALQESSIGKDVKIELYDDNVEYLKKFHAGKTKADVLLIDSIIMFYYMSQTNEKYYILSDNLSEEEVAIGFRKGDQSLRDRVQEILSELKEDGALAEISKKWFGADITIVNPGFHKD